jgi:hypothetical protein
MSGRARRVCPLIHPARWAEDGYDSAVIVRLLLVLGMAVFAGLLLAVALVALDVGALTVVVLLFVAAIAMRAIIRR